MHAFGFLFFVAGGGCVFVRGEPPFVLGSVRFGWLPSFWVGVVLFLIVTRSFRVIPTLCLPRPDDIEVQYIAASRVLSGRSGLNYRSRHPWQSSP